MIKNIHDGKKEKTERVSRKSEITTLLSLSETKVVRKAGRHLRVFDSCDDIHRQMARDMADFITSQNGKGEKTKLILPVGPVGQYPIFLDLVHAEKISLGACHFFFMDEHADNSARALPAEHPLSFKGQMEEALFGKIDKSLMIPRRQVIFPDEKNVHALEEAIEKVGGIDICFGGIGIHGHLAYNEPEPDVRDSGPRLVYLNDFTVTINAIRAGVGGNLEGFPRKGYTLGMRQILGARKIILACRNGIELDWANTVLRLALLGSPGGDYPCTYLRNHANYIVYTDMHTLRQPKVIL